MTAPSATAEQSPIRDWWWYSCVALAWVAALSGSALDLYYRYFFVWPESRMQARGAALGWHADVSGLCAAATLSLVVALPALFRRRLRRVDVLAVALPVICLWIVLATK